MRYTYNRVDRAAPFWAAFGAPLVGAPIMLALFVLAPARAVDAAEGLHPDHVVEQTVDLDGAALGTASPSAD